MPNRDAPRGFFPVRHMAGGVIRASEYQIAGGLAADIFSGDPVKTSPGTNKRITVAVAGDPIVGVFGGCMYTAADGSFVHSPYWPSGTAVRSGTVVKALVYDDPNILFGIQADAEFTATMIGQLFDFAFNHSGNTSNGVSGCELDVGDTGAGRPLKAYELLNDVGNAYGEFAKVGVIIDLHENLDRSVTAT